MSDQRRSWLASSNPAKPDHNRDLLNGLTGEIEIFARSCPRTTTSGSTIYMFISEGVN